MHVFPDAITGDSTCHLGAGSSKMLGNLLSGKNVVAFLHGHIHSGGKTTWNSIDVIGTGFSYMADKCSGTPTFMVINITDNHITAVDYNWNTNQWGAIYLNKAIAAEPTTAPALLFKNTVEVRSE